MKKKLLNVLKFLGFLSIGVAIIFWFWYKMTEEQKQTFIHDITHANYFWLVLSICLGITSHISRALRWRLIFEPIGYNPSRKNLFLAVMSMYFGNMLAPRLGEVARCTVLQKYEKVPFEKTFGTVVAERAVDFIGLIVLLSLTVLLQLDYIGEMWDGLMNIGAEDTGKPLQEPSFFVKNLKWIIIGTIGFAVLLVYLLRKKPFFNKIFVKIKTMAKGFWQGLASVAKVKKPVAFIAHTVFIWLMYYLMTYVAFFALEETSHMSWLAPLSVLIFGSFAIMFVPNGTGAFQIIVAAILGIQAFGYLPKETGLSLGTIIWAGQTILILLVGGASVALLPVLNKDK